MKRHRTEHETDARIWELLMGGQSPREAADMFRRGGIATAPAAARDIAANSPHVPAMLRDGDVPDVDALVFTLTRTLQHDAGMPLHLAGDDQEGDDTP